MDENTNGAADIADTARETGRVDAFSDGVFAIAVTLLVLNLATPDPNKLPSSGLLGALLGQWPVYTAYVISFAFILIMWVNHHNMFKYIVRVSHGLLLFNGLLLLFITVAPFPTALMARYLGKPDAPVAAAVYSGLFLLIALAFNVMWFYIARHPDLLDKQAAAALAASISRRYQFGPLLYLVALGLAFVNVPACLLLNVALAVFFALPHPAARVRSR